jgi:hypothetical protein
VNAQYAVELGPMRILHNSKHYAKIAGRGLEESSPVLGVERGMAPQDLDPLVD